GGVVSPHDAVVHAPKAPVFEHLYVRFPSADCITIARFYVAGLIVRRPTLASAAWMRRTMQRRMAADSRCKWRFLLICYHLFSRERTVRQARVPMRGDLTNRAEGSLIARANAFGFALNTLKFRGSFRWSSD